MNKFSLLLHCVLFLTFLVLKKCQQVTNDFIVGEIEHSIEIINGESVVKVPIPKLKGVNKLVPELELIYLSNEYMKNKEIGLGWSFNGSSEISRCFKTYSHDDSFEPVKFNNFDRFCLDGQRLILIKGHYGMDKSEYRTEIESYKKIILSSENNDLGPQYFKIFTKSNLILTYGLSSNSSVSLHDQNVTYKWLLNKIEDYAGNSINYGYVKDTNYTYLTTIKYSNRVLIFNYVERSDIQSKYMSSKLDSYVKKILKSIILFVNDKDNLTEIKRFEFEYVKFGPAKLSLLKKIKLCYPDDRCAPPLTFKYQSESAEMEIFDRIVYQHNICSHSNICELKQVADMNGDGKMDIVGFGADGVYVSLKKGANFDSPIRWTSEFTNSTVWHSKKHLRYLIDINNDGLPDIAGFGENGVYVSLNTQTGFKSSEKWHDKFGFSAISDNWKVEYDMRMFHDLNNDGFPDILGFGRCKLGTGGSCVAVSYGNGKSFDSNVNYKTTLNVNSIFTGYNGIYWGINYPFFLTDIDADGLTDIFGFGPSNIYSSKYEDPLLTIGNTNIFSSSTPGKYNRFVNDLNNDHLPDMMAIDENNNIWVGASNALSNGFFYNITNWNKIITTHPSNKRSYFLSDVNADGFHDLIIFDCVGVHVMMNNGTGFNLPKLWNSQINLCEITQKGLIDFDGDGLEDIYEFYENNIKVAFNANKKLKLSIIIDSLNNQRIFSYGILDNKINQNEHITNDNLRIFGTNIEVVSKLSSSDGIGGLTHIEYNYGSYVCNKRIFRKECAFASISSNTLGSPLYFIEEYYLEFPLTGVLRSKKTYFNQVLTSSILYNYDVKNSTDPNYIGGKMIYEILQISSFKSYFDLNGDYLKSEILLFKYDYYGNPYFIVENITNNYMNYSKISSYVYKKSIFNSISWFNNQLDSLTEFYVLQTPNKLENKIKEQKFEYNKFTRLLTKKVYLPNNKIGLEKMLFYNDFGNIVKHIDIDLGSLENRTKLFKYDSNGLNIIESVNEIGVVNSFSYDFQDNLIKSTDSNGLSTFYEYNLMGSKVSELKKGYENVSISFSWDFSIKNSAYSITKRKEGAGYTRQIYDSFNRVIRTVKSGFNSDIIFEDTIYDSNGLIKQKSMPYKGFVSEPYFITIEYDALKREIRRIEPGKSKNHDNFFLTYYSGLNVLKQDSLGNSKIEKKNILGQIVYLEDSAGSVAYYEYDVFNNLKTIVDSQGISTVFSYNENNKIVTKSDPYIGVEEYYYNAFNELMKTTFVNGKSVLYTRDPLGRLIRRIEPEGETTWTYDTSVNGRGQIHKISSPVETKEYFYDEFGRETEILTRIKDETYSFKSVYDPYGRVSSQIYPSNLTVFNCYNQNGYLILVSITDQLCRSHIWKANDFNAMKSILYEQDINGIQTLYKYNNFNQVTDIRSLKLNSVFRNIEYEYDSKKNLIKKTDHGTNGNIAIQKYSYDSLDRLIFSTSVQHTDTGNEIIFKHSSWVYDSIGNILYSNDLNEMVYTYDHERRQLPLKIGNDSIVHDERGNIIKTDSYEIIWSSFVKPLIIKTENVTVHFDYGSNRERIIKSSGDYKRIVHYVENLYEKTFLFENNTYFEIETHFIKAFDRLIAVKVIKNGSEMTHFTKHDAFGSLESIFDDKGKLLIKYSYNPFGSRSISFSNLSVDLSTFFNLGFSSNDYIVDNRLVNFKGRIFDCVYARFLNPDPFIKEPYNIQNLNRYSYGLNNPFKYNDPSGYFWKTLFKRISQPRFIFIVISIIGAFVPVASAIAAAVTTSTVGAIFLSAAIVGAGTILSSGLILGGDSLKNGLARGTVYGSIAGGIRGIGAIGYKPGFVGDSIKFSGETINAGFKNELNNRDFFDGFEPALYTFVSDQVFNKVQSYKEAFDTGGPTGDKGFNNPLTKTSKNKDY